MLHDHGLGWRRQNEESKASDGTGAKIDDKKYKTDNHLNRSCPTLRIDENSSRSERKHYKVEKSSTEIDTGYICRDVVNELPVCKGASSP